MRYAITLDARMLRGQAHGLPLTIVMPPLYTYRTSSTALFSSSRAYGPADGYTPDGSGSADGCGTGHGQWTDWDIVHHTRFSRG